MTSALRNHVDLWPGKRYTFSIGAVRPDANTSHAYTGLKGLAAAKKFVASAQYVRRQSCGSGSVYSAVAGI